MKKTSLFSDLMESFRDDIDFKTEQAKLAFTEQLSEIMVEKDISRVNLSERLGVSKSFVTRVLNGSRELTIRDCVAIGKAVECDFFLGLRAGENEKKRKRLRNPNQTFRDRQFERCLYVLKQRFIQKRRLSNE